MNNFAKLYLNEVFVALGNNKTLNVIRGFIKKEKVKELTLKEVKPQTFLYYESKAEVEQALQNLNYAESEFIDVAIKQYDVAISKFNIYSRKAKEESFS